MYHGRPCTFDKWRIYVEAQLAGERGGLPCSFLKIKKSPLTWVKKYPDCIHLWAKFLISHLKWPYSKKPSLSWKILGWVMMRIQDKHYYDQNIRKIRIKINSSFWRLHKNIYKPQHKMTAAFRRVLLIYVLVESS